MKISYLILFALFFVSTGCICENHFHKKYLNSIDEIFIDHFPEKVCAEYSFSRTFVGDFGPTGAILVVQLDQSEIDSISNHFTKQSKKNYLSTDPCLLVVNKFTTKENRFSHHKVLAEKKLEYVNKVCLNNKLPVPNFFKLDFATETTTCRLPEDYVLYVLDAEPGIFGEAKQRVKTNYMPSDWIHGYSKGVAVSKKSKQLIYWYILW
ncbi:MAG: hypothetical protein ACXITV_05255 [Luteibaculaceae bacterium]